MDVSLENLKNAMEPKWVFLSAESQTCSLIIANDCQAHFGRGKTLQTSEKVMELINSEKFRLAASGNAPMIP
jgi:hypothetical protein